jgi:hypothetical protein
MKQDRIANQDLIPFDPVPRRDSVGGWTAARQRAFITALAATGSVARAAAAVKMSKTGVYNLRAAEGSEDFVRAWNAAVENGVATIKNIAFERAVDGIEEDVWYHGEKRGKRTRYDNRLLATLLRLYAKPRGDAAQFQPPPMPRADIIARLRTLSLRVAREEDEKERAEVEAVRAAAEAERLAVEPRLPFDRPDDDDAESPSDPVLDWRTYVDPPPAGGDETQRRRDIAAPAPRVIEL